MSLEEYRKALRQGKRIYRTAIAHGESPYLPVLSDMVQNTVITTQESLGIVDIPIEQIAGTYTRGRQLVFSNGFFPLMAEDTEFAQKWIALCRAHLDSGIRDPIIAYEFMNRFYVVEGHKRVSVLRHFGADSIRGTVTRMIPQLDHSLDSKLYHEYLSFYARTAINYLWFSKPESFSALLAQTEGTETWSTAARTRFRSFYSSFRVALTEQLQNISLPIGDAMLLYLNIYDYRSSAAKTITVLRHELEKMSDEIHNSSEKAGINLILKPEEKKVFIPSILSSGLLSSKVRIAFIHDKSAASSSWISAHELGRKDLEAALGEQIETTSIQDVGIGLAAEAAIRDAIADKCDLIFTTSPRLLNASVKTALLYPKARILNCSLHTAHPSVRTYYIRMYESKFLMGLIAGCLTENDSIGYLADYPIYGIAANINAFARGVQLVNPRAKIHLHWTKTQTETNKKCFMEDGISYVSDRDIISPNDAMPRYIGLYNANGDAVSNLALSFCHWGRMYERIVRSYLSGYWKNEQSDTRPINYWWGMDSDMIELICSRKLPEGTMQLLDVFQRSVCAGSFRPFSGIIRTQNGRQLDFRDHPISPKEMITMDWLMDSIIGSFPEFEELIPEAQSLVRIQGLNKT